MISDFIVLSDSPRLLIRFAKLFPVGVDNRNKVDRDDCNDDEYEDDDSLNYVSNGLLTLFQVRCVHVLQLSLSFDIITGFNPRFFTFNLLVRRKDAKHERDNCSGQKAPEKELAHNFCVSNHHDRECNCCYGISCKSYWLEVVELLWQAKPAQSSQNHDTFAHADAAATALLGPSHF